MKRGRKKNGEGASIQISIKTPPEEVQWMNDLSVETGLSKADTYRMIITAGIKSVKGRKAEAMKAALIAAVNS